MAYKHILLALELDKADKLPTQRAVALAQEVDAKLTILHSIEHVSSYGAVYGVAVGADIEEMLMQASLKKIRKVGEKIGVPESQQIVKFGPAKYVVLEEAKAVKADLIVVGSHGRHGMRLILGSTANAVLHGAEIDVLAVRLKN